jgi:hypothetical protein
MMGIATAKCLEELPPGARNVIELGNQRFTAASAMVEIANTAGIDHHYTGSSTPEFYTDYLGFDSYLALDTNEKMGARSADLNHPITDMQPAELVTNNGTGEHVFNQAMVFENIHELTVTGGVMLHVLPMMPWLNHGFYNYNPILFRDLAHANGYQWLFLWIGNRWGSRVDLTGCDWAFAEKNPRELWRAVEDLSGHGDLFVVAALRKVSEQAFRFPMQGKYNEDSNITDANLQERYK